MKVFTRIRLQVMIAPLLFLIGSIQQVKAGEASLKKYPQLLILSSQERQCIFGQVRADKCIKINDHLLIRSGFTSEEAFGRKLCNYIHDASNYDAVERRGVLAFEGNTSIRTVIDESGDCTLISGEYPSGYQLLYTEDLSSECTRFTTIEEDGPNIVTLSRLFHCDDSKYKRSEPEMVRKIIAKLKNDRPANASYYLGELALPINR